MDSERRQGASWPILFLLLSHSVWTTLQCVTISPQPNRQPVSIVNIPREEYDSSTTNWRHSSPSSSDSDELPGSSSFEVGEPSEYFTRHSRGGEGEEEKKIQLCSQRLREALEETCKGIGYVDPSVAYGIRVSRRHARKRSFNSRGDTILRRTPRTLVDECCKKECLPTTLFKYCNVRDGQQSHRPPTLPPTTPPQPLVDPEDPRPTEPENYNPLFHLLQILNRHLKPKIVPGVTEQVVEETWSSRSPSEPQARIQYVNNGPSSPVTNYEADDDTSNNVVVREPALGGVGFRASGHTNFQDHDNSRYHPHYSQKSNIEQSTDQSEAVDWSRNVVTAPSPKYVVPLPKSSHRITMEEQRERVDATREDVPNPESSRNVVTKTWPKYVIPLGRNGVDYK